MRVVTAAEMRTLDQTAINTYDIPGIVLMENAGLQVVKLLQNILNGVTGKEIAIFVGKGNNGGDGMVVARHLFNRGAKVKVGLLVPPEEMSGDAGVNMRVWQNMGQPVSFLFKEEELACFLTVNTALIVDAIFGTGFKGKALGVPAGCIEVINAGGKPVVAVDIPSGLEADTGQVHGPCVKAAHTVTFALPKLGLVLDPGINYTGKLHVVDISIPSFLLEKEDLKRRLITEKMVQSWLPPRPLGMHKGDCGRVLVVAGSRGMTGAACMTAESAARVGAGLVILAVPASVQPVVAGKLTEVMTVALPETKEQTLSQTAREEILSLLERSDVLALGPGISTHPETVALVRQLIKALPVPGVIDADGLNALVGCPELFAQSPAPLIITPHPGELARLLELSISQVQTQRLSVAEKAAALWKVVVVLKGAGTVIAAPDGETYINPTGNPGMATGGMGDVLTGVITGFLAQGMDLAKATAAGAFIHGLTADRLASEKGIRGLLAGDVMAALPKIIKMLEKE
jgi:NAD(P)H-hydrate epimerase